MSDPLGPPTPGGVVVGTLTQAQRHKRKFDAVLTLEDPGARQTLRFTGSVRPGHLVLACEDADSEEFGYATMTAQQMEEALSFGRRHAQGSMLVHCVHGIGRSAACAIAILTDRAGPGSETQVVEEYFALRPFSAPNLVAIQHADRLLQRGGALVEALAAFEATSPVFAARRQRRWDYASQNPSLFALRVE